MSKKSERIFDAITNVNDRMVEAARPKKRTPWRALTALAAALALVIGLFAWRPWQTAAPSPAAPQGEIVLAEQEGFALAKPVYPVMAQFPNEQDYVNSDGTYDSDALSAAYDVWREGVLRQTDQPEGYAAGLDAYCTRAIQTFLAESGDKNVACSPLNLYMALAMLAETTAGESRAQLLDLLGADSMEALRAQAASVWNANYRDDGISKCVLAGSLWLRDDRNYNADTVNRLAQDYYASVFRGEMGSQQYDKALQDWLNEQTGGQLKEQAAEQRMAADTVMALATTINFHAKWASEFYEGETSQDVFHGAGGDETADFMHMLHGLPYYRGAHFQAVALPLQVNGFMWFLLPDEGVTPQELLADAEAASFLLHAQDNAEYGMTVDLALPKFDTASSISLLDGLNALGVTDVCDPARADFSPLLDGSGVYLSDAEHAVRVAIDEEGVTAAAFTVMAAGEGGPNEEHMVHLTLDRPFLYCITGDQGLPLFVGIVNHVSDM